MIHCLQKKSRDLGEEKPTTYLTFQLERLSLLTEVRKRNNRAVIKNKMDKTFSLQRQEKGKGIRSGGGEREIACIVYSG